MCKEAAATCEHQTNNLTSRLNCIAPHTEIPSSSEKVCVIKDLLGPGWGAALPWAWAYAWAYAWAWALEMLGNCLVMSCKIPPPL